MLNPPSVLQEKDITPDPQLLDKFNDCSGQVEFMRYHSQPVSQLPSDLADIIDFFIALTICNTVVVSSPNQPRQKVHLSITGSLKCIYVLVFDQLSWFLTTVSFHVCFNSALHWLFK